MKNLMLGCACIAITSGIVSVNLWRDLRADRALIAELRTKLTAAEQRGSGPPTLQPRTTQPATESTPTNSTQPPTATTPTNPATNQKNAALAEREMLKDPEYRKARLAQLRLGMPQSYPGLAEELGLSPAEAGQLWDLLAENQLETNTSGLPLVNGQLDLQTLQERNRLRQEAQRKLEDSLLAMLGDAGFGEWQGYQETRPGRQRAAQLNKTLESNGAPLNDVQMRSLTTALLAEQKRQRDEQRVMSLRTGPASTQNPALRQEENFKRQAESNRRIIEAAAPGLSARQLETLRASLEQPLAMNRATSRVQREMAESQSPP